MSLNYLYIHSLIAIIQMHVYIQLEDLNRQSVTQSAVTPQDV